MSIVEKYNQEKECTIQYDISELLQTDLSDYLRNELEGLDNNNVTNFMALFPIQNKSKIKEIKDSLKDLKVFIPDDLFEAIKEEVREICDDYK